MSDIIQDTNCCTSLQGEVKYSDVIGGWMCETATADFPLEEACDQASYVGSYSAQQQAQSESNPFNWDGLNNAISGIGSIVGTIFGLGTEPTNPYASPTGIQDTQNARQTQLLIGFGVLLALIVGGVVISRRRK